MNRRSFLRQRWAALTALLRAKRYQALAAFTEASEAENLRDELAREGIDATTFARASEMTVIEVHVASADFRRACDHINIASRPKSRRQFSLRAVLFLVTILCVLLALIRQVGLSAAFWAAVFIPLGGFKICFGLLGVRRGRASWNWPHTRGAITRSYLDWNGAAYSPQITYRFSVDGFEYMVETVTYMAIEMSGTRAGHEMARRRVAKFPVGLGVDVFYDPVRPRRAVLERGGRTREAIAASAAGLVLMIMGFLVLLGIL